MEFSFQNNREVIYANGIIDLNTVDDFKKFILFDTRRYSIRLNSMGGNVQEALRLGRLWKKYGYTIFVYKNEYCMSMCPFLLMSGRFRFVHKQSKLSVHQIWIGKKVINAREEVYYADEINAIQNDISLMIRYTIEMGISTKILEKALETPIWNGMYDLNEKEIKESNLAKVLDD